jgi:hypothetical protein
VPDGSTKRVEVGDRERLLGLVGARLRLYMGGGGCMHSVDRGADRERLLGLACRRAALPRT